MKKELMLRLINWCNNNSSKVVRYYIKDTVTSVVVYRYTGFSKDLIQVFKSNSELENFLDESEELEREINRYNENISRVML